LRILSRGDGLGMYWVSVAEQIVNDYSENLR
jgi:hypothetical protein